MALRGDPEPGLQFFLVCSGPESSPCYIFVAVVKSLSCVRLFATSWIATRQSPPSSTISRNLLKFTSIESVKLSNRLILCSLFILFNVNLSQHHGIYIYLQDILPPSWSSNTFSGSLLSKRKSQWRRRVSVLLF